MHLNVPEPKVVIKPWGKEIWLANLRDFCIKSIVILKGHKTSYQYHVQKEEINFIRNGIAEIWLENEEKQVLKYSMKEGDSFFVPAHRKHRVIAVTDLELFEVSNEFIDDVVRIDDEFGRSDGKIEAEHQTPAVLIFTAGLGSRLKHHTTHKNKALVPIGSVAAISRVIEKIPLGYDIVMAVGYGKESLIEYCDLAHPDRKIAFVHVSDWENPQTNPGHSIWQCREHLQRPFYLIAPDSLIDTELPHIDGNWIGVYPTDFPEKYATVELQGNKVSRVSEKGQGGFDHAFIGIAAVWDYKIFWNELETSLEHKLMEVWRDVPKYPTLSAKILKWFDVGNLDDLEIARQHFTPKSSLNSAKSLDEVTYKVENQVLKFHPKPEVSRNRYIRGMALGILAPSNLKVTDHFLAYDWESGKNLYEIDNPLPIYNRFLDLLANNFYASSRSTNPALCDQFYRVKTLERASMFALRFGAKYLDESFIINGRAYPPLRQTLDSIDWNSINQHPLYSLFHGDLHFDNVVYNGRGGFTYVDWRESFAGNTMGGDIYYDLGKLYAGCLFSFELLKNESVVQVGEGISTINFSYSTSPILKEFLPKYEDWISANSFLLDHVIWMAGLAFLNISPLHGDNWSKARFFKSIEFLHGHVSERL